MANFSKEHFGIGDAGRSAWDILAAQPACKECKAGPATHTIDFDVVGDLTQVPVCDDCDEVVRDKVTKDVGKRGMFPSFGTNGRGRA